jgi:hypothetical protein
MLKDYKLWKGEIRKEFNASDLLSNNADDEESCDASNFIPPTCPDQRSCMTLSITYM